MNTWIYSLHAFNRVNLYRYDSDFSTAVRLGVQGKDAKKGMHAFFFFADCYHEVEQVTSAGLMY